MAKNRKKLKPGVKPKDIGDRLVYAVWYWSVRSRGLNDSQLDKKFQLKDSETGEPKRLFLRIRKTYSCPPKEIVTKVNASPKYRGTARILRSPFRKLIEPRPSFRDISDVINQGLKRFRLQRLSGLPSFLYRQHLVEKFRLPKGMNDELRTVLLRRALIHRSPADLDMLAFIGALLKEAEATGDAASEFNYRLRFEEVLTAFCGQRWMKPISAKFKQVLKKRVLDDRMSREWGKEPYGNWSPDGLHVIIVAEDDPLARYVIENEEKLFAARHRRKSKARA